MSKYEKDSVVDTSREALRAAAKEQYLNTPLPINQEERVAWIANHLMHYVMNLSEEEQNKRQITVQDSIDGLARAAATIIVASIPNEKMAYTSLLETIERMVEDVNLLFENPDIMIKL